MLKQLSIGLAFFGLTTLAHAAEPAPIVMVNIPAGTFTMGCVAGRDNTTSPCEKDESPAHQVNVAAFQMSKHEVTRGQWRSIMGSVPSGAKNCDDNCAVGNVSWDEAQTFIQKLNASSAGGFRLPTEAEWEYACRAGEISVYCGGNNLAELAWYDKNSGNVVHAVGQKKPNAFGLYDMTGNVWEWVQDCRHTSYIGAPNDGSAWEKTCEGNRRRIRGGGFDAETRYTRAALRVTFSPSSRFFYTGFRLVKAAKP